MDHIQGLGFFAPLYRPDLDVHIWGPASTKPACARGLMRISLARRLFPVRLGELPCALTLHEVPGEEMQLGEFHVQSALVCHPALRLATASATVAVAS
jgi:phosphoribosyl 1,2-cyclic phosphodiesterase